MGRSLIGFIFGVVVTACAFFLFDASTESPLSEVGPTAPVKTRPPETPGETDSRGPDSPGQRAERLVDISEAIAAALEAQSSAEDGTPWDAELRRQFEEAGQILSEEAIRMLSQPYFERATLELARQLEGIPVVSPTPLPPQFDWMAGSLYLNLFHEQFQREYIDSAWAAPTQRSLERLVYDRPEIIEKYGAPTIRCHSTRCEVIFVASGEWASAGNDVQELHDATLDEMPEVFDCETGDCWAVARNEGGAASIFWGIERKRQ